MKKMYNNLNSDSKGGMYHVNGVYTYRYDPGREWGIMYGIAEALLEGTALIGLHLKHNVVTYTDTDNVTIDLFRIHTTPSEENLSKPNCGKTWFKGTFESFVTTQELLDAYLDVFGRNHACQAIWVDSSCNGPRLGLYGGDEKHETFLIRPCYI